MQRKRINVSTVQKLGINEIDDGFWTVSSMRCDLGYISPNQKIVQPTDNPFDTRLSPTS